MKRNVALVLLSLQLSIPAALAQQTPEAPGPDEPQVQEVAGVKDPEWKPYRQMLKGVDAYDEYRQLAPKADLRFVLRPNGPKVSISDVTLRIAGTSVSIPVPIAADGTFTIPRDKDAANEDADIVVNKKKSAVRWRTEIRTPELPENTRRLGDLRLTCRINWAVLKDDMGFFRRSAIGLLGGPCGTGRVKVFFAEPRAINSATLVDGERREVLALNKDASGFTPPLADASWSNDALVMIDYAAARDAAAAAPLSAANK